MNPCRLLTGALALAFAVTALPAADKKADKSNVVKIGDVTSAAPAEWKREKPKYVFRQFQFKLPRAEGDPADVELYVSDQVIGKSDDDIFKRWKKLFVPPTGQTADDIAKVSTVKAPKVTLVYLDIKGTYLEKQKPIDPDFKAVKRPNYRMIRVIVKAGDEVSYVSMTGPAKSVEQYKKGLDDWLKAFK